MQQSGSLMFFRDKVLSAVCTTGAQCIGPKEEKEKGPVPRLLLLARQVESQRGDSNGRRELCEERHL